MASRTEATVLTYGLRAADVVAESTSCSTTSCGRGSASASPWGDAEVRLAVRGHHQVANALAAAAAALAAGAPLDAVAAGLGAAVLSPWRMDLRRTAAGALVLNDAYNANPTSMAAALRSLAALDAGRRVAVLGTDGRARRRAPTTSTAAVAALAAELGIRVVALGEPRYGGEQVPDVAGCRGRRSASWARATPCW